MNGNTFTYSYDGNGMRYEKIVNGIRSDYYYSDTQLLMENRNGTRIYYIYGATGIEGFVIRDIFGSQCYYFDKNTMGDIVAIRQHSNIGNIVATYEYDAWGNVTVMNEYGTPETSSDFIGNINPFRYRGYYYDTETGFYYLQTRYYDPETYRFINADDYELIAMLSEVVGQLNLYAYCNNNPIMYTDETGEILLSILFSAIIGAAVSAVASIGSQLLTTGEVDWGKVGISAAFGAVSGTLAFTGVGGIVGQFAMQGALGVAETYSIAALNGTSSSIGVGEVVGAFLFSGTLGAIGAKGAANEFKRIGQIEASFVKYAKRDISKYGMSIIKTVSKRGSKYIHEFLLPTFNSAIVTTGISSFFDVSSYWVQRA